MEKLFYKDDVSEMFSGAVAGNFYRTEIRDLAEKVELKEHEELLEKINFVSPFKIKRDLYVLDYFSIGAEGATIIDKNGLKNPVVPEIVKNFNLSFLKYSEFEMFNNIISHEYGHIIYEENLKEEVKRFDRFLCFQEEARRRTEAFAFWFGDYISGVELNKKIMDRYSCSEKGNLYEAYSRLKEIGNKDITKCFNPKVLSRIFYETK